MREILTREKPRGDVIALPLPSPGGIGRAQREANLDDDGGGRRRKVSAEQLGEAASLGVACPSHAGNRPLPSAANADQHPAQQMSRLLGIVLLAAGVVLLAKTPPVWCQQGFSSQSLPEVPIAPSRSGSQTLQLQTPSHRKLDAELSSKLTDYLHAHRLPYVKADVFRNASGNVASVNLTGKVRTPRGKEDAGLRTEDLLGATLTLTINNQVQIDPNLSTLLIHQPSSALVITDKFVISDKFWGCWTSEGTSSPPKFVEYLGGCERANILPQTTVLCFLKTESTPGYKITYQSERASLRNFQAHVDVTSSDGARHINMVETASYETGLSHHINASETVSCDLTGDQSLACDASMLHICDGTPWYRISGAGQLHRVGAP